MGINKQIRDYQNKVLEVVNEAQLPLEIKRLVISEILNALAKASDDAIEQEAKEGNNECME